MVLEVLTLRIILFLVLMMSGFQPQTFMILIIIALILLAIRPQELEQMVLLDLHMLKKMLLRTLLAPHLPLMCTQ